MYESLAENVNYTHSSDLEAIAEPEKPLEKSTEQREAKFREPSEGKEAAEKEGEGLEGRNDLPAKNLKQEIPTGSDSTNLDTSETNSVLHDFSISLSKTTEKSLHLITLPEAFSTASTSVTKEELVGQKSTKQLSTLGEVIEQTPTESSSAGTYDTLNVLTEPEVGKDLSTLEEWLLAHVKLRLRKEPKNCSITVEQIH